MLRARRGSPEKKSVSPRYELVSRCRLRNLCESVFTHIFEVLEEIGHGFALAVSEDGLV